MTCPSFPCCPVGEKPLMCSNSRAMASHDCCSPCTSLYSQSVVIACCAVKPVSLHSDSMCITYIVRPDRMELDRDPPECLRGAHFMVSAELAQPGFTGPKYSKSLPAERVAIAQQGHTLIAILLTAHTGCTRPTMHSSRAGAPIWIGA